MTHSSGDNISEVKSSTCFENVIENSLQMQFKFKEGERRENHFFVNIQLFW